MKYPVKLSFVVAFAVIGIAACTSTQAGENAAVSTGSPTTTASSVVTQFVTHTVTNPAPAKTLIDSFGFGALKLGMSRQDALNTRLIGPGTPISDTQNHCTVHTLAGTELKVQVSTRFGVAAIPFTADMSSTGAGIGAALQKVKGAHPNLRAGSLPDRYQAAVSGNPNAQWSYHVPGGKVSAAHLVLQGQDCLE